VEVAETKIHMVQATKALEVSVQVVLTLTVRATKVALVDQEEATLMVPTQVVVLVDQEEVTLTDLATNPLVVLAAAD